MECRGVVESGAVSYLLGALSSYSCEVRMAATHCLSRFAAHLKASKCREKPQVRTLLCECTVLAVKEMSDDNAALYLHVYTTLAHMGEFGS